MTAHNQAGCEDPLCQQCEDYSACYVDGKSKELFEVSAQATDHVSGSGCDPCQAVAWKLSWRFCLGSS